MLELSETHDLIRQSVREFAEGQLAPYTAHWDEAQEFPGDAIRQAARLGLMGMSIPEQYGGSGMDALATIIAIEEIARVDASVAVILSVQNSLVGVPILLHGTVEQRARILPRLASGEWLGCYALTEPQAGSDASNLLTTAHREDDCWILNGTKQFITNGAHADIALIYAVTDAAAHAARAADGISAFLVERQTPGFHIGRKEDKLGIRASDTVQLHFQDCRVSGDALLGESGRGYRIALETLGGGRLGIGAQALGIAQGAFEDARNYAATRTAFGKPLSEQQVILFALADMDLRLDASRLLLYRAATLRDAGKPHAVEAAKAKLFCSETAAFVTDAALQIHGGYGFIKDYPIERRWRDARITRIYEGTSEIQRIVIGRAVVGR